MKRSILIIALFVAQSAFALNLIPKPLTVQKGEGSFVVDATTEIVSTEATRSVADYLVEYLPLKVSGADAAKRAIRLSIDAALAGEEYRLSVMSDGIEIEGGSVAGLFNGVQTLLQLSSKPLYDKHIKLPVEFPLVKVADKPHFGYRGFMLDVARTYIPTAHIKRYIDLMAYHKMNKLHIHLTDDEGWRVELKSHPEFAREGGFRGGDSKVPARYGKFNEKWGGYYTQQELRDIVAYAAERNIEVIPEIDMPGHSRALAEVYPQILCNYTPDKRSWGGRDLRNAWCIAKQSNYTLIEEIIKEMVDIFPSKYFHIGGDEVALGLGYHIWSKCPDCIALMKSRGYTSYMQLQDEFTQRVSKILAKYGKVPMVWNEAAESGVMPKSTTVCGWQSTKHCREAAANGYPTIVMPGDHFYFDSRQSQYEIGHKWAGHFDVEKVSSYSFKKQGYTPQEIAHIKGVCAAFWGELYVEYNPESCSYLDYMLFPRLCAVASIGWRGDGGEWKDLSQSLLGAHYRRMDNMGVEYRLESPILECKDGELKVSVKDGSKLYYTDKFTGKVSSYSRPLDSLKYASRVSFHSVRANGRSAEVAMPAFYKLQNPKFVFASSVPSRKGYEGIYKGRDVQTARVVKKDDWFEYRFEDEVVSPRITFRSGYDHLRRRIIVGGYLEVSYDGKTFERVGTLTNGAIAFKPKRGVRAVRVVSTEQSDAETGVLIKALRVE